ncbi:MAG: ABC transporter substrate binding protein [Chloroflexota bacterium]
MGSEGRFIDGNDQLAEPAAELIRLDREVIVAPSATVATALHRLTTRIPITIGITGAPVALELAATLGRPGDNVTGTTAPTSLARKQIQILHEAIQTLSRFGVVYDASGTSFPEEIIMAATRPLDIQWQMTSFRSADDPISMFEILARDHVDGLLVLTGPMSATNETRLAELALTYWCHQSGSGRSRWFDDLCRQPRGYMPSSRRLCG